MLRSNFSFHLPDQLIAQTPSPERTASRLLVLDRHTGVISDRIFADIHDNLEPGDLLVMNDTRVIRARLYGRKETGGKVEVLIERVLDQQTAVAQVRASKTPRTGQLILLDQGHTAHITGRDDDLFKLDFSAPVKLIMEQIGHIPLPPYISRADNLDDADRYQTVFARKEGAIAAPTAGLHFDQTLLDRVTAKGVRLASITLHVGAGTFQPVRVDHLQDHVMHTERIEVPQSTCDLIRHTRANGGRVIALGTTTVRALESACQTGHIQPFSGETDIFIYPGYTFRCVDALITNFHLPESTLLMLVCAFAGKETVLQAYQHAVEQHYRFFSYGDAMFIS